MKKLSALIIVAVSLVLATACEKTCRKPHQEQTSDDTIQVVEASVTTGDSYRYSLPSTLDANNTVINNNGTSGSSARIENAVNAAAFVYTPASNFTGTEEVEVSSGNSQGSSHNSPSCGDNSTKSNGSGCSKDKSQSSTFKKHQIKFRIKVSNKNI